VRYALRLLEKVSQQPEGVPEETLAQELELPPQQLGQLLLMLREEEYILQLPDGGYTAGQALLGLNSGDTRQQVREEKLNQALDKLRQTIGAAVYIGRYANGEMTIPHVSATEERPAVNQWVDFRYAAHATAIGKCLLSQLDHDGRQDHFSRHKAARLTSRTITDRRVLLTALERQPATMPMLDLQEYAVGTLCAAVPLTAGSAVGCLALSLPVGEAHRLREAAETLNEQAAPALLSLAL
jgi:DNA-binding IclR family transcriptional regulator